MRTHFIYLSFFTLFCMPLLAQKAASSPSEIVSLIAQIKDAHPQDKRILMNKLKLKLRAMNEETRLRTMKELRRTYTQETEVKPHLQHKSHVQQPSSIIKPSVQPSRNMHTAPRKGQK